MIRLLFSALLVCLSAGPASAQKPWIIAAGAGGAWPECCPVSFALAIERGANTVRIPVSLSRDNQVVVVADPLLSSFTDAAGKFPDQTRADGSLHVTDLDLSSLRQITASPLPITDGAAEERPPQIPCTIAPLSEILAMISSLEHELGRDIGVVIELRKPWLHRKEGKDLSKAVIDVLASFPTHEGTLMTRTFLASHDADELERIHHELLGDGQSPLGIIQLLDTNDGPETQQYELGRWRPYNYDWLFTGFGLRSISAYTDAIGLPRHILTGMDKTSLNSYIDNVQSLGIAVLAYPADPLLTNPAPFAADTDTALGELFRIMHLDGLMTGRFATVTRALAPPRNEASPGNAQQRPVDRLIEHLERRDQEGTLPANPILLQ